MINISPIDNLTPREQEILLLAGQRLTDKEIAQHLDLSPRTIQNHLHRAYEKLGVSNRIQAARLLSDYYSGEPAPLSPTASLRPHKVVIEDAHTFLEDGKAQRRALHELYAVLEKGRRPRKLGGSVLWLILLWALAWLMIAVIGASLISPVLEIIERLR